MRQCLVFLPRCIQVTLSISKVRDGHLKSRSSTWILRLTIIFYGEFKKLHLIFFQELKKSWSRKCVRREIFWNIEVRVCPLHLLICSCNGFEVSMRPVKGSSYTKKYASQPKNFQIKVVRHWVLSKKVRRAYIYFPSEWSYGAQKIYKEESTEILGYITLSYDSMQICTVFFF